ncbi:hypothetical protein, partial [Komagataeibacter nataicola]|uniref:hypothetical protein n=1 Tax=Komagataeibacter nataicola TaxID=265960 RepID=UPI002011A005
PSVHPSARTGRSSSVSLQSLNQNSLQKSMGPEPTKAGRKTLMMTKSDGVSPQAKARLALRAN